MSYTLERLAGDIRRALMDDSAGREGARAALESALQDRQFVASVFGPERTKVREVIYEDPDLGFCICAHVYADAAYGQPHDHGPSWAIYGQAEGITEMTDWRIVRPVQGEEPALVEPVETYELKPGMAHIYEVGAVHAPRRAGPTKLVRVEGQNLDNVTRTPIKAAQAQSA